MDFLPAGHALITGGEDGSLRRWDPADRHLQSLRTQAHNGPLTTLALSVDGKILATGGSDREVKVWTVDTQLAPKAFASIESKVQSLALTRDGKLLVTASADGSVQLWDTTSGKEQGDPIKFEAKEVHVAFSPDGKILATLPVGTNMAALKLWDTATKHELDLLAVVPDDARTLAFTPDGHSLATAGSSVNVWGWAGAPAFRTLKGTPGLTRTIAVSRDGSTIATAGAEGVVMLWDVADGVPVGKLEGHTKATWCLAFSPDGKTLASGGADRTVRLWNVGTQTEKATLRGAKKAVTALAFAPDGKALASSCDGDPTVSFWDVASSRLAATLTLPDPVPGEGVACLAFTSDGKTLYTGGERGISVWDVSPESRALDRTAALSKGQERVTLRGHTDTVRSLWSLDGGKALATRGEEGVIKVWDLALGRERLSFGGASRRCAAWQPHRMAGSWPPGSAPARFAPPRSRHKLRNRRFPVWRPRPKQPDRRRRLRRASKDSRFTQVSDSQNDSPSTGSQSAAGASRRATKGCYTIQGSDSQCSGRGQDRRTPAGGSRRAAKGYRTIQGSDSQCSGRSQDRRTPAGACRRATKGGGFRQGSAFPKNGPGPDERRQTSRTPGAHPRWK